MHSQSPVAGKVYSLINKEVQDYILAHENDDLNKVLLKHKFIHGVPASEIIDQIRARKKARLKLPEYYRTPGIVYPPPVNLEQSSSEATARFKATLIASDNGQRPRVADLTGGFGIDAYYLSLRAKHLDYVEPDKTLGEIAKHNHKLLAATNLSYHQTSCEAFLSTTEEPFDFFYVDPSRRVRSEKTFRLPDASPNLLLLQPQLLAKSKRVLIKASPLLDLKMGIRDLKNVSHIVVVAVENECRELLFMMERNHPHEPVVRAVDLDRNGAVNFTCSFTLREESESVADFSEPLRYLYEPNSAILKAGAFRWIAQRHGLFKLAPATHLYSADEFVTGFPGRIFKVIESVRLDKNLKKAFAGGQCNIIVRNHPLSVEGIKKKTAMKEGGEHYLICGRTTRKSIAIIAARMQ